MVIQKLRPKLLHIARSKRIVFAASVVVGLFVGVNIIMLLTFHGRALPNYYLGKLAIGGKPLTELQASPASAILPAKLTFTKDGKSLDQSPEALGVSVNVAESLHMSGIMRWLPALSLVGRHHVALSLHIDRDKFDKSAGHIDTSLGKPAIKQHITFDGATFVIVPNTDGFRINRKTLLSHVMVAFQQGESHLNPPTETTHANDHTDLSGQLQQLQQQINTRLTFNYGGQSTQPTKSDIGKWYVSSGQSMEPSTARIAAFVTAVGQRFGVSGVANQSDLATATLYALTKSQSFNFAVVPNTSATVIRTYCTAVDGVNSSVLSELNGKLATTYADTRGWNNSGHIAFRHVNSGCQYTVWMSAASQMTNFGAICDSYWNCQVGTSVIMNYNRWTDATPSWNKTGASLDNYHTMMINHETGHRLGFLDNYTCPKPGGPAPIMLQQSINLRGCTFNIWPLASEFTALN